MISECPTCGTKLAKDDFMSFAFILGGDICRHCLNDDPSGSKEQSMTIWLQNFVESETQQPYIQQNLC